MGPKVSGTKGAVIPIFKTLRSRDPHDGILDSRVESGWESWDSLDSALIELGAANWELGTPLYGSLPPFDQQLRTSPVAIILVNKSADAGAELQRQTRMLEKEIAALRAKMERLTGSEIRDVSEKLATKSRIDDLRKVLDGLRQKSGPE